MSRATRIATTVALALAIGGLPVVLDRCAASCETHQDAAASTPACHHATSGGSRIAQVPTRCGHDHGGTTATAPQTAKRLAGPFEFLTTGVEPSTALPPAASTRHASTHAPPAPPLTLEAGLIPLRI